MNPTPDNNARGAALLDDSSRDELAVKHLDLVPRVVGRLPIAIPAGLDRDDLHSAGMLGLLTAARTFQPMRGASFRTFAYTAIRAAVLDELRRHDPLPRGARGRLRLMGRLEVDFRASNGRLPTSNELALGLGVTEAEAEQLVAWAEVERLLRSDPGAAGCDDAPDWVDPASADPGADAERRELLEQVEGAIRELSPRERQVIVLYFSEGLLLKEIGELLDVTESRICQILTCATRKVRARLMDRNNDE